MNIPQGIVAVISVLVVLAIICAVALFKPYQEAKSFNKFSEHTQKATTWDALFLELRVEACNVK